MKKVLAILFASLAALSLFACGGKQPVHGSDTDEPNNRQPVRIAYDTLIQDANGEHKCLWEDGKVLFDEHSGRERQIEKSASLTLQTEYDMWFSMNNKDLDLTNYYYPVEFNYDKTKIEIKTNPDKENHFILTVLHSCDKEKVDISLTDKSILDDMLDKDGEPARIPTPQTISIIITAEA